MYHKSELNKIRTRLLKNINAFFAWLFLLFFSETYIHRVEKMCGKKVGRKKPDSYCYFALSCHSNIQLRKGLMIYYLVYYKRYFLEKI